MSGTPSATPCSRAEMAYLDALFGLAGHTAVVTGGSSGIGRAMAVALGRAGARIVLVARREKPMAEVVAGLPGHGVETAAVSADLADRAAVTAAIDTILSGYGVPDVLVNAAAINRRPPLADLTEDDWDATLAANLTAPFLLGQ